MKRSESSFSLWLFYSLSLEIIRILVYINKVYLQARALLWPPVTYAAGFAVPRLPAPSLPLDLSCSVLLLVLCFAMWRMLLRRTYWVFDENLSATPVGESILTLINLGTWFADVDFWSMTAYMFSHNSIIISLFYPPPHTFSHNIIISSLFYPHKLYTAGWMRTLI